jgi:hypothetical protein
MEKNPRPLTTTPWGLGALLVLACLSCPGANGPGEDSPVPDERAAIHFLNLSSYRVDIYKNFNPSYFDPTTWLCRVDAGQVFKVRVPGSTDKLVGDTFYPRYQFPITLENSEGVFNFYVAAKSSLENWTFVVENNKTYTKTIPQPSPGQLTPTDGYFTVQNQRDYQIRIENGGALRREDNGEIYLAPGQTGIYKMAFSYFDGTVLTVSQLRAFVGAAYIDFSPFSLELGKLYHFAVKETGAVLEKITPLLAN